MAPDDAKLSLRGLLALEARVGRAQLALQRISDRDPAIEKRIRKLMRSMEARDRAMALPGGGPTPARAG
jgi:hypothetical protein